MPDIKNERFIKALEHAAKGGSINNICPIITYSEKNGATFMWMGDLETAMQQEFYNSTSKKDLPKVDILFAPHHGSNSGSVPPELLDTLNPKIIIVGNAPCEHLDYYDSSKTFTQNSSGDICFNVVDNKERIYTKKDIEISNRPKGLVNETFILPKGWFYCGTLNLNSSSLASEKNV